MEGNSKSLTRMTREERNQKENAIIISLDDLLGKEGVNPLRIEESLTIPGWMQEGRGVFHRRVNVEPAGFRPAKQRQLSERLSRE